jgi:polyferredoxin
MEDPELRQKLESLEKKVDSIFASTEKTRKYFLWVLIVSVAVVVVPLIGLVFAIPSFISTYSSLGGL